MEALEEFCIEVVVSELIVLEEREGDGEEVPVIFKTSLSSRMRYFTESSTTTLTRASGTRSDVGIEPFELGPKVAPMRSAISLQSSKDFVRNGVRSVRWSPLSVSASTHRRRRDLRIRAGIRTGSRRPGPRSGAPVEIGPRA